MERTESFRKVEIREEITDLFNEFEEDLKQEFQDTAFNIMEEVENHYRDITLNNQAIPELMQQIKDLLRSFPKKLLIRSDEAAKEPESSTNRLKFKQFIETDHPLIEWAIISIEKLGVFVTGDSKGEIVVWDSKSLEPIKQHSLNNSIKTFAFDALDDRLIVASDVSTAENPLQSFKISQAGLDLSSSRVFDCKVPILTMVVLERERKLLIEDVNWRIQVWDLEEYRYSIDIKVEGDQWFTRGDGIAYLPQSKLVAVPGADKQINPIIGKKKTQDAGKSTIRLFSLETGEMVKEEVLSFKNIDQMLVIEDKLVLMDTHGAIIFLDATTLKETARLEFDDSQVFSAIYSKKLDLLVCTTESPVVMLIKFSEAKVLRKLHPKAIRCEKSLIYLEEQEKLLVPFQVDESDEVSIGVLDLGDNAPIIALSKSNSLC